MTDTTHATGCWGWGPRHYECAVGQVKRDEDLLRQALKAENARLRAEVERRYHPCTYILIEGLKRLEGGKAVLAEWDRARAQVDAAMRERLGEKA